MRLRGYTDADDWTLRTFLAVARHPSSWDFAYWPRDPWRLSASYFWYDGPNWQVLVGPFALTIGVAV